MKKLCLLMALLFVLLTGCEGAAAGSSAASVGSAASGGNAPVEETAPDAEEDPAESPISVEETSGAEEFAAELVRRENLSYPLTEEQVTLSMFCAAPTLGPLTFMGGDYGIQGYEDYASVQKSFEITGVTVDFANVSSMESSTLFALHIASGDLSDMLSGIDLEYSGGVSNAYAEDIVVDLSPYVEEYCPAYMNLIDEDKDLKKSTVTDDGEMLMLYFFNDYFIQAEGSVIRTDWLDKVNMEIPSTIDELHDVLLAFQSEMDCANPFYFNSACCQLLPSFNLYNYQDLSSGELAIYQIDGTVYSNFTSENYRQWLRTMNTWYSEGLIDPDFVSVSASNMGGHDEELLAEDNLGVWAGNINSISNYYSMCPNEDFAIAPVYFTYDGEINHTISTSRLFGSSTGTSGIAISTDCENVELALGYLDFWYTEEGYYLKNYGVEGESYNLVDGQVEYTDVILNNEYDLVPAVALLLYSIGSSDMGMGAQDRTAIFYDDVQSEARDVWTANCDGTWSYPNATLTTDESSIVGAAGSDVTTYIAECVPKFIMGELDVETEWDTYVDTCNSMGMSDCLSAYQSALDRYNAR